MIKNDLCFYSTKTEGKYTFFLIVLITKISNSLKKYINMALL